LVKIRSEIPLNALEYKKHARVLAKTMLKMKKVLTNFKSYVATDFKAQP
jgi:hypothetical protein